MKQENNNVNSAEFDYQNFNIDEKDFRMWVFDRHNSEDSEIFEPVKIPDRNKIIEQIPPEYTAIREFLANSRADELALELTEKRRQHRKELEKEYIKEKLAKSSAPAHIEKQSDTDSFDIKSENLRKALVQAYENTDAKISFSSLDYSQIKKDTTNPQKRTVTNTDDKTDEEKTNSQLKKYKTANICLITLIFALLIFFVGQRYIERNSKDELSLFYPLTQNTTSLQEVTEANTTTFSNEETPSTTDNSAENTTIHQETNKDNSTTESTTLPEKNSLININTAAANELQQLEGIGEVKAARIIEYRETYGKFSSKRDILKVSGIGEKTYEKIKDKITID